jgi:hypothetical protein
VKFSRRTKKLLIVFVLLSLVLEISYVSIANIVLRERRIPALINTRPEKLRLDYAEAWTVLPGLVHLSGVELEGHDGPILWRVELEEVDVMVDLFGLLTRRFHALSVRADGGRFWLRRGERLPVDADLPSDRAPFRIHLNGISLKNFKEISVFDYSYQGPAFVGGEMRLWPGRSLEIDEARVDFGGGKVIVGNRTLSSKLSGRIDSELSKWLPQEEEVEQIFDKINAHVALQGGLEEADFLNHYFQSIPWMRLLGVTGDFSIDATISDGVFRDSSSASITAKKMGAGSENFRAQGAGRAEWNLDSRGELPRMRMNLTIDHYVVSDLSHKLDVARGDDLKIVADSYDLSIRKMFSDLSDLSASIVLDRVNVTDLRFINNFIPLTQHFEVLEGTATLEAKLQVSTRRPSEVGFCKVEASGARARFRDTQLSGDFAFQARIEDTEKGATQFEVSGSRLAFSDVRVLDNKKTKKQPAPPWSGEVGLEKAHINLDAPVIFYGHASLGVDDARPVLAILANTSRIARNVARFADMKKLRGTSDFRVGPNLVEFTDLNLKSSDVDLRAQLRLGDKTTRSLALIEYGILELGLAVFDNETQTKVIKSRKWYEARLPWKPDEALK